MGTVHSKVGRLRGGGGLVLDIHKCIKNYSMGLRMGLKIEVWKFLLPSCTLIKVIKFQSCLASFENKINSFEDTWHTASAMSTGTVKPVLRDHCHERPPVLKDHIIPAEGPTFQCNWTCHQRPPVLRDNIFMANGVVFQDRFYCTLVAMWSCYLGHHAVTLFACHLCWTGQMSVNVYEYMLNTTLYTYESIDSLWVCIAFEFVLQR